MGTLCTASPIFALHRVQTILPLAPVCLDYIPSWWWECSMQYWKRVQQNSLAGCMYISDDTFRTQIFRSPDIYIRNSVVYLRFGRWLGIAAGEVPVKLWCFDYSYYQYRVFENFRRRDDILDIEYIPHCYVEMDVSRIKDCQTEEWTFTQQSSKWLTASHPLKKVSN